MAARLAAVDDAESAHSAAYRVVLRHVGFSQRFLARAACVCVAWRDTSRAAENNAVMRFDDAGAHVAGVLVRFARVVTELHVPHLRELPAGVSFPRLTLVEELAVAAPPLPVMQALAAVRVRAPSVLAALRTAPSLRRWMISAADVVPTALSLALSHAIDAERRECERRGLLAYAPAVADAMRGLLPPEREHTDPNRLFTARILAPGVGTLNAVSDDLPKGPRRFVSGHKTLRINGQSRICDEAKSQISNRCTALSLADTAFDGTLPLLAPRAAIHMGRIERLTLLHQAVAMGSLGAVAVLLRAGADPLMALDENGPNTALSRAAAEVAELITCTRSLAAPDPSQGILDPLIRLALRAAPTKSASPRAVAMLWLLGRAAEAKNRSHSEGDDVVANAISLPVSLAVLRAWPNAVAGLSGVASLGVARTAFLLVKEAEAFMDDEPQAPCYSWMQRARASACALLFAVPVMLIAALTFTLAVAFSAPFGALALALGAVWLFVWGAATAVSVIAPVIEALVGVPLLFLLAAQCVLKTGYRFCDTIASLARSVAVGCSRG